METETIDRLFLELSQVTRATTSKELALQALVDQLRAENARLREAVPSEVVKKDIDYLLSCIDGHPNVADEYERVSEWLARVDAGLDGQGGAMPSKEAGRG